MVQKAFLLENFKKNIKYEINLTKNGIKKYYAI
jgi:hypothetical protein